MFSINSSIQNATANMKDKIAKTTDRTDRFQLKENGRLKCVDAESSIESNIRRLTVCCSY